MRAFLTVGIAGDEKSVLSLGQVSTTTARQVKRYGVDITGFQRQLIADDVRHALKNHGRESKKYKQGQRLSKTDISKIPAIIDKAHHVEVFTRAGGKRIQYTAKIGKRRYTYVETIGTQQKRVTFKNLWRRG